MTSTKPGSPGGVRTRTSAAPAAISASSLQLAAETNLRPGLERTTGDGHEVPSAGRAHGRTDHGDGRPLEHVAGYLLRSGRRWAAATISAGDKTERDERAGKDRLPFAALTARPATDAVDIELVHGAREGIGPDATLLIDAGCVWDARTALRRAHAFAEQRPEWLEEALQPDDIEGYRWLRDRSPIPIAAGEEECGRQSFRPLIDRHALDVYQVDLSRNGFTDASYIKQRVEEIGARLCNHCYTSPITHAASLHWLSTCRDAFLFEDCVEDSPLRHRLTAERVQAESGWITVPDRPGLGVTLDEDFIAAHLVSETGARGKPRNVTGEQGMGVLDWLIVLGLNGAVIVYGFFLARGTSTSKEWFLGSRALP